MTNGPQHTNAAAITSGQRLPCPPWMGGPGTGLPKARPPLQFVAPKPKVSVLTREERVAAHERIMEIKRLRIQRSRQSAASCAEYILRDEASQREITNAPIHEEFHRLADLYPQLIVHAMIESGKSTHFSVLRPLYELGKNPNLRIAIVSETDAKAIKLLRGIKRYLAHSKELREVFPHLVRSKNKDEPWNAHAITVARDSFARDPSIQVTGVGGSIIGSRIDLLILDDVLSHRTAITKSAQEKLLAWFNSNCAGRLTENGRIIAVGTPWAKTDLYHTLAKMPGWTTRKFPVIDPKTGEPTWPENWSSTRIQRARERLGPLEAARQLDCEPADESTNRFPEAHLARALEVGKESAFVRTWSELFDEGIPAHLQVLPAGCFTVTGVDVGASMRSSGGLTVLTSILVYPSGLRQILCIESGRWTGPQILQHCYEHHARYRSTIFVETNAAQRFLLDFAEVADLDELPPILPHTTGRNKHDPTFGVESISVEMFQGRWAFPNDGGVMDKELAALLAEMRAYSPDSHMGDRVSSLWIANMGAHTKRRGPRKGKARARAFAPMDGEKREYDL